MLVVINLEKIIQLYSIIEVGRELILILVYSIKLFNFLKPDDVNLNL